MAEKLLPFHQRAALPDPLLIETTTDATPLVASLLVPHIPGCVQTDNAQSRCPIGPLEGYAIVSVGLVASTVHDAVAGVGSALADGSSAVTATLWDPSASPLKLSGDVQPDALAPSTLH